MRSKGKQKILELLKDKESLKKELYPSVIKIAKEANEPPEKIWKKLLDRILLE